MQSPFPPVKMHPIRLLDRGNVYTWTLHLANAGEAQKYGSEANLGCIVDQAVGDQEFGWVVFRDTLMSCM